MKAIRQIYVSTLTHHYKLWIAEVRENTDVTRPPDVTKTTLYLPIVPGLMYELYFDHELACWNLNFFI